MTLEELKTLISTLQSLGVTKFKDSATGLELELSPLRHQAAPLVLENLDPEAKRVSIMQQLKELQQEEEDLESWST